VRVCAHAGSDLENEVGGVLLGQWRLDSSSGREYVVVEAVLRARHTRHGSSYLTFTTDSLVALHEEKDQRYPGKELVGWYHTHPGMGVFLSGHDLWLHRHFFPEAWQVALVIEPHSSSGGFFVRRADGSLTAHDYVGFYELVRPGSPGVVHWRNLVPEPTWVEEPEGRNS
jgi:proteasome lid subunit RPN8/RPN11